MAIFVNQGEVILKFQKKLKSGNFAQFLRYVEVEIFACEL